MGMPRGGDTAHLAGAIDGKTIWSATASDCTFADAMATALIVLGPDEGFALAAARGLAAYFIVRAPDGGFIDRSTPAFAALRGRRIYA